jgi:hypothetical protein
MATDEELVQAAKEMMEAYGPGRVVCDPSDPQTIEKMTRAGLNAEGNRLRREDGVRDMGSRIRDTGDGRYRLYVHSRCVNLISELQTYDPKLKERDHAVDALRYGLSTVSTGPVDAFTLI